MARNGLSGSPGFGEKSNSTESKPFGRGSLRALSLASNSDWRNPRSRRLRRMLSESFGAAFTRSLRSASPARFICVRTLSISFARRSNSVSRPSIFRIRSAARSPNAITCPIDPPYLRFNVSNSETRCSNAASCSGSRSSFSAYAESARAISESSTTAAACADENCVIEPSIFSNSRSSRCVSASCERTESSASESLLAIVTASSVSRLLLLVSL